MTFGIDQRLATCKQGCRRAAGMNDGLVGRNAGSELEEGVSGVQSGRDPWGLEHGRVHTATEHSWENMEWSGCEPRDKA